MIEIDKNYYLIDETEVTDKMELLSEGLYQADGNLYEVAKGGKSNSAIQQKTNNGQTGTVTSYDSLDFSATIIFVLSILLLAFSVLCLYIGINYLVQYGQSGQLGMAGEIIANDVRNLRRDGVLWILGGAVSLILGGLLALIYNLKKMNYMTAGRAFALPVAFLFFRAIVIS